MSVFLLFSINASASVFSDAKASYYDQQGDYSFDRKKYTDAYEYYTSASEYGSGYAYFQLYAMNYKGEGRSKNSTLATKMLHKAVELQYPMAEVILAERYLYKKPRNRQEALRLLKSAAKKEYLYAYIDLYHMYSKGIGVRKNSNKANQYYRLAKANGYDIKQSSSKKSYTSSNKLVRDIQSGLKKLGFYKSKVDGITGPMTRKSIADFQNSYGYPVNSKVSSDTLKKIKNEL